MNKNKLILLGLGLVCCGGMMLAYWRPGSEVVSVAPNIAKLGPKPATSHTPDWKADDHDQDVSASATPGETQPQQQPAPSELARRFQDALASGGPKQTLEAMTAWADADPAAAAQYVASMEPGPQRDRLLREVAQRWAARDSAAALAWATQSGTAAEQAQEVEAICEQVGKTSPQEGIALAERSGLNGDYATVKGQLAEQWAAQDPSAAVNWALSRPKGEERNQFVAEVASVQSGTSPTEAARPVLQEIPPGPEQDNAVLAVIDGWARQDLASATAWVNQFPADLPIRERAKAVLAAAHFKQSPP